MVNPAMAPSSAIFSDDIPAPLLANFYLFSTARKLRLT
jgi:hypothetical protein